MQLSIPYNQYNLDFNQDGSFHGCIPVSDESRYEWILLIQIQIVFFSDRIGIRIDHDVSNSDIHHIKILEIQLCIFGYKYVTDEYGYGMLGFGYDLTI
jgi:hypothetical protein